jgi:hypothetical protein
MKDYHIENNNELHYDRGVFVNLKTLMIDAMEFCNEIEKPFAPEKIKLDCSYDPYIIMRYDEQTKN